MRNLPRILVVDDDPINIRSISECLKPDYQIMAALNADQALRAVRSMKPDLVLLDVMMPGTNGLEVCRQIKSDAQTSDIPVIFITAMDAEADEAKGLDVGAQDYITKPIVPAIVRARVRVQIELRRSLIALQQAHDLIKSQRDRMEQELKIGQQVQVSLLPQMPQGHEAFSIVATMIPAMEVSGDFYDAFMIDENRLCMCIADVSGKGVPAALFMSMCTALVRSRAMQSPSPAAIATAVNADIGRDNEHCMFVTLFVGVLDCKSGLLVYTNAGHTAPLVKTASGIDALPARHGAPVGVHTGSYEESTWQLDQGQTLLLFTDGVTEARNNEGSLFGTDRLTDHLGTTKGSPGDTVSRILASVRDFQPDGENSDDITLMALRFDGCGDGRREQIHRLTIDGSELYDFTLADVLESFINNIQVPETTGRQLFLVLEEIVSNVARHGYQERSNAPQIQVEMGLLPDRIRLSISDNGASFDPCSVEPPDITLDLNTRSPGGLGIHLCRNIMDDVRYERVDGYNQLTLTKQIA